MRILLRKLIKQLLLPLRNHGMLILKDKMVTSDHDFLTLDGRINAMCHNILDLRMKLLMNQITLHCLLDNSLSHRVREMLLETCRNTKQLIRRLSIEGYNIHNGRLCLRQGSCLIKHDRVCLSHRLKILTALHGDIVCTCLAYR